MSDRLEDIKKELKVMEGREIKLGSYTSKMENDLRWLVEQAEKVERHKEIVGNVIDRMSGYDAFKYADELEQILKD